MAFRYLIYSTGTTYTSTIIRESATNNPGANEASYYTDFVIPEIQPLYLWRVDNATTPTDVIPNTDANINAYLAAIAPPPQPEDDASVGYVTGITTTKIDKVTGAEPNIPIFNADGGLDDSGYVIGDLTGGTSYTFVGSGGTQVTEVGSTVTIYSALPTGTTVSWGDIAGTLSAQTDLQNALDAKLAITDFNSYTGTTATEIGNKLDTTIFNSYTGTTATEIGNKLDSSVFNAYTGTSQPVLDAALTGVTNLGTGTTLGLVSGRNATLKSISVLGGLSLGGDLNNLIISGETNATVAWGDITGTLSNQTDLQNALDAKLAITDFNSYTGTTDTRLQGIEGDITYLSGQTDNKLDITDFNSYTGTTDTRLQGIEGDISTISGETANKLDSSIFNAYTGTTQPVIDAALTGATNGLTPNGRNVELGGALTKDTVISGTTFDFTVNTDKITLQGISGIDIIDTDGTGGINIESDAGTIKLAGNTSLGAETTKLEISETSMLITDSRATKVGLEYAADYSTDFTNESLITKRYADAIASGLIPKAAVLVATTADSGLSGLTTVDGITLQAGDRVLVKDNTDASENGIYIAASGVWARSSDFDGNPDGEVSSGNMIPIISGDTQYNTIWVLVTPNPITVGTTDLEFTLFSSPHELIAGTGIAILANTISVDGSSLAGNSISWTGNTFNVDVASGTLATALGSKQDTITGAATTITDTDLTASRALVSDGSGKVAVSTITATELGYLSGTTANIQPQIDAKLATSVFNTFTGTTLPTNYYNKTEINVYTGATDTRLQGIEGDISYISGVTDTKLPTAVFSAYTGTTAPNEIFLIHTGGTDLNTIAATAIEWDSEVVGGAAFSWTGSSEIQILETGQYELSYNIPYNADSAASIAVGGNVILNNSTVIDLTAAAGYSTDIGAAGNLAVPTVILSLTANDVLTLATFRTGRSGSALSSATGSILIKKKNTLQ